ncbi:MAG: Ppx/GppA family phosphatase [Rhizobiales bacterium]|nr:Ppx/GppA family phosphatase [Hyphomicrobiales bacterium]
MPSGPEGLNVDATANSGPSRGGQAGHHGRNPPAGQRRERGGQAQTRGEELTYGALDLGTNNCRLLVASPSAHGFKVVDAFSRIVRLGEGLGRHGRLNEAAMDRTIEALRVCSNKLKWHRVARQRLVATEACRLSANGAEFIARVAQETGLELEIIDRETEAHLAAAGAEPLLASDARTAVVFDIGGGSTEVMWVQRSETGADVLAWISLAAGVVTLSERHGGGRDVVPEKYDAMRDDVRRLLMPFVADVQGLPDGGNGPDHLLGTSGTVTTIAGVHLGLRHYDRSRVDGCWLMSDEAERVTQHLRGLNYDDRAANGCIGRERADLVLAGCAILDEIRAAFPGQRIRVADRGLREGILAQMMRADGHLGKRT